MEDRCALQYLVTFERDVHVTLVLKHVRHLAASLCHSVVSCRLRTKALESAMHAGEDTVRIPESVYGDLIPAQLIIHIRSQADICLWQPSPQRPPLDLDPSGDSSFFTQLWRSSRDDSGTRAKNGVTTTVSTDHKNPCTWRVMAYLPEVQKHVQMAQ